MTQNETLQTYVELDIVRAVSGELLAGSLDAREGMMVEDGYDASILQLAEAALLQTGVSARLLALDGARGIPVA